jgi:hypothetical protein
MDPKCSNQTVEENFQKLSSLDKRDLILAALEERLIRDVDIFDFFTTKNHEMGLRVRVQPYYSKENEGVTHKRKINPESVIIPFCFGDPTVSGGLLRFSISRSTLLYRNDTELNGFILLYLVPDHLPFIQNFLVARQLEMSHWVSLANIYYEEVKEEGEREEGEDKAEEEEEKEKEKEKEEEKEETSLNEEKMVDFSCFHCDRRWKNTDHIRDEEYNRFIVFLKTKEPRYIWNYWDLYRIAVDECSIYSSRFVDFLNRLCFRKQMRHIHGRCYAIVE